MSPIRTALAASAVALLAQAAPAGAATPREKLLVTPAWLKSHAADRDLVILHVGSPRAYETAHIPGARYVPMDGLSVSGDLSLELPDAKDLHDRIEALGISDRSRIVVYLADGQVPAATRVVFNLDAAGLGDRVSLLDGGLAAWTKAGGATQSGAAAAAKPGKLAPLKMQAKVADAAFVQKSGWRVIDARAPMFYDGLAAGGAPAEKQPKGHIPGATNLPFTAVSASDNTIKSAADLTAQFRAAGVKPGDKVVVYCHVGWQGSAVVFAARSLGIDAKLYDGSFQDWSQRKLPVEGPK